MAALKRIFLQTVILTLIVWLKEIYCLKSSTFFDILCLNNSRFWFMHNRLDCFKDGVPQCEQLALLPERKRLCIRCCNNTSPTPILKSKVTVTLLVITKQSPPKTAILPLEILKPQPGWNISSSLATIIVIFIAAAVVLFVVALQRKFGGCKRKHDTSLEAINPVQGDTLQCNTEVDITTEPTQEEGDRLMTGSPDCTIIPLGTLTED